MSLLLTGLIEVMHPLNLLAILVGLVSGFAIGALPGLGSTVGTAIFIPLTYGMSATQAMLLLVSLYVSSVYAGQVPAILFRIPGAEEAVATTLDGYPMTQKGQAGRALGYGLTASIIGSLFGAIILILLAPLLASVALKFGPPEYFALGVLGLTAVSGLCGKSMVKAAISVLLGLLFAAIGVDPMSGMPRFTFGTRVLLGGIPFIPTLLGLFAVAEVFKQVTIVNIDTIQTNEFAGAITVKSRTAITEGT